MTAPTWMDSALCRETDPEAFFPEKGQNSRAAKAVCARCPMTQACLDFAVTEGITDGIWGGMSPRQRADLPGFNSRRAERIAERERFARLAKSRGAEAVDIADHLGVDEYSVYRYVRESA